MKTPIKWIRKKGIGGGGGGSKKKVIFAANMINHHTSTSMLSEHGGYIGYNSTSSENDSVSDLFPSSSIGSRESSSSSKRFAVDAPGDGDTFPNLQEERRPPIREAAPCILRNHPTEEWPPPPPDSSVATTSLSSQYFHPAAPYGGAMQPQHCSQELRFADSSSTAFEDAWSQGATSTSHMSNLSGASHDMSKRSSTSHVSRRSSSSSALANKPINSQQRSTPHMVQPKMFIRSTSDSSDEDLFEVAPSSKPNRGNNVAVTNNNMPPQDFALPRKEVRDAIKYHDKLGKTLSMLALDPSLKCVNINDMSSNMSGRKIVTSANDDELTLTLTHSTDDMSTLDSSRLNGLEYSFSGSNHSRKSTTKRIINSNYDQQQEYEGGQHQDSMMRITKVPSTESKTSTISNRSARSIERFETHLSFLETHIVQNNTIESSSGPSPSDNITPSISNVQSNDSSFFPSFFPEVNELNSPPSFAEYSNNQSPQCFGSPPSTPMVGASTTSGMKDKIVTNIKQSMGSEMEQYHTNLKSTVIELSSEQLHNTKRAAEKHHVEKENDNPQFLNELERSFQSMEENILQKLSTQLDKEAMYQRQMMEDLIDDRVSKAIAGSSLEMNLALQECKKESARVCKMNVLRDRPPPPPSRTPPRIPVKNQSGIGKKRSPKSDKSWMRDNSSGTSTSPEESVEGDESRRTSLEKGFQDTMRVIDEFVDDCDDIANDFDRIVNRMRDVDVPSDPEYDDDDDSDFGDYNHEFSYEL